MHPKTSSKVWNAGIAIAALAVGALSMVAGGQELGNIAADRTPWVASEEGLDLGCVDVYPWQIPPGVGIDWDCIPPFP